MKLKKKTIAEVFYKYPIEIYIKNINNLNKYANYRKFSDENYDICKKISCEFSNDTLDYYHKIVILYFILSSIKKLEIYPYTNEVKGCFIKEFRRIIEDIDSNDKGFYEYSNDLFCKDLATVSLRMFPAGLLKVESWAGIPKSCVLSNRGRNIFSWLKLVMKAQGFSPFYEIHLDVRYKNDFTPDGWTNALRTVGEMLLLNPHIKGITGASWFFDPQIKKISPHLIYLRRIIEENRGFFFFYKINTRTTELAISNSNTRKALYKSKKYKPISYFMVWLRSDILRWINL